MKIKHLNLKLDGLNIVKNAEIRNDPFRFYSNTVRNASDYQVQFSVTSITIQFCIIVRPISSQNPIILSAGAVKFE